MPGVRLRNGARIAAKIVLCFLGQIRDNYSWCGPKIKRPYPRGLLVSPEAVVPTAYGRRRSHSSRLCWTGRGTLSGQMAGSVLDHNAAEVRTVNVALASMKRRFLENANCHVHQGLKPPSESQPACVRIREPNRSALPHTASRPLRVPRSLDNRRRAARWIDVRRGCLAPR
jgi:hypothetical protein